MTSAAPPPPPPPPPPAGEPVAEATIPSQLPPPPPGYAPPPLSPVGAPGKGPFGNLTTPMLAAIVGGAVVVIGAIVGLVFALGGGKTHHQQNLPPTPPPVSNAPSSSPAPSASTAAPVSTASPIAIGQGVSLTPANGWKVGNTGAAYANVISPDGNVQYFATSGKAAPEPATQQLQSDVPSLTASGYKDIQLTSVTSGSISGSSLFDSWARGQVTMTDSSGNQVTGFAWEMMNSQSGVSTLIVVTGAQQTQVTSLQPDIAAMNDSIIGVSGQ